MSDGKQNFARVGDERSLLILLTAQKPLGKDIYGGKDEPQWAHDLYGYGLTFGYEIVVEKLLALKAHDLWKAHPLKKRRSLHMTSTEQTPIFFNIYWLCLTYSGITVFYIKIFPCYFPIPVIPNPPQIQRKIELTQLRWNASRVKGGGRGYCTQVTEHTEQNSTKKICIGQSSGRPKGWHVGIDSLCSLNHHKSFQATPNWDLGCCPVVLWSGSPKLGVVGEAPRNRLETKSRWKRTLYLAPGFEIHASSFYKSIGLPTPSTA